MSDRTALRATIAFVCLALAILAGAYGRARGLAAEGALPSLPVAYTATSDAAPYWDAR